MNDNVWERNWSPPRALHVVTNSANGSAIEDKIEPELMNVPAANRMWYDMDGSPWSFIRPFLDL